jgi:hypothetical protein
MWGLPPPLGDLLRLYIIDMLAMGVLFSAYRYAVSLSECLHM